MFHTIIFYSLTLRSYGTPQVSCTCVKIMFLFVLYDVLNSFKSKINMLASLVNFYEITKFIYCYFCFFLVLYEILWVVKFEFATGNPHCSTIINRS
jgi:hypothetical protein